MFEAFGVEYKEGETKPEDALSNLAEKWSNTSQVELKEDNTEAYMTQEQAKEALGAELKADEILSLAKEGQEYRKQLINEALAMGVRAMGNDFPKETYEKTFASMASKDIKAIMQTWEKQAKDAIPAGRKTDPAAGQKQSVSLPDVAFKVGK